MSSQKPRGVTADEYVWVMFQEPELKCVHVDLSASQVTLVTGEVVHGRLLVRE